MPAPARNTLAIVGAGPIGLEAASAGLDAGFDVHVFERGEAGAHVHAWGHVRMFTPWRMNLGPSSTARLERAGWTRPDLDAVPTGRELAEGYLDPLAKLPELKDRVHLHAQVVAMSRSGALKQDTLATDARREHPFRLLVRDASGRENLLHAFTVIDASGVYGSPNWGGDGGIPARGELYLAPQMSYHVDDVLGLRRERHAGRRTLVIGSGASAATLVLDLVTLAAQVPNTSVAWATRHAAAALYPPREDTLPGRRELHARARAVLGGAEPAVTHAGGVHVDGFEFNSATHRYRVAMVAGGQTRVEEVDQVLIAAGFGPDNAIYRELKVHECDSTRAPLSLATALLGADPGDCLTTPGFGADVLANPEPDFWILGHKSYGRNSHFLLETGYAQVSDVMTHIAGSLKS